MYFPWTVVAYPLAQAVEDHIVKAPIIVSADPLGHCGERHPARAIHPAGRCRPMGISRSLIP